MRNSKMENFKNFYLREICTSSSYIFAYVPINLLEKNKDFITRRARQYTLISLNAITINIFPMRSIL